MWLALSWLEQRRVQKGTGTLPQRIHTARIDARSAVLDEDMDESSDKRKNHTIEV